MGYPTQDKDFTAFTIGSIKETSDEWLITSQNGLQHVRYDKSISPYIPHLGGTCRVYGFNGTERGLFVCRRRIFYRENQKHSRYIKQSFARYGLKSVSHDLEPEMKRG